MIFTINDLKGNNNIVIKEQLGGEILFNLSVKGKEILAIETPIPAEEAVVIYIRFNGD
ncbi:hypothetical protein [Paenibacillus luteus]|uniref:hypothetical protein n=1 Tax=Paenibacillus luteus TaxID=2545753 RepID=UPI001375C6EE|nr:hypothetical protein [Paenibacillus luteus]